MPTKEFDNVQLDVTFIQAVTRSNITSGEDIATSFGKISKWFTDLKSIAWNGHPTVTQKDTTSTISPNHEETFTVVDSVTRNGEGHVTGINVKTVKLPTGSGYVHPTHDSHASGLYKITVDELGHVSDATAVTKTDITDLGIPGSDTNTTYTLSGAYGSGSNTWVTKLTPSSGSATTSTVPTASTTAYGITKLSSATNSTSTSLAATASAVKAAYDKANHSHPYLPLSGGTISSSSYGPLIIERSGSTNAAAIVFKNTNGTLGSIGMTGGINGGLFRSDGTTVHTVLDTGNLTSYTYSSTASRTANTVLAAPNGSAGAATFRALVTADLPASGATAGSYGPSANVSPAHSGTFSVPYITINAKGQVTAASTKTITLPASGNTDTKVTQTNTTTSANYRVILSGNANDTTETTTARKSANFLANPSTGEFYAKGYRRIDITGKTIDINSYNLSSGAPMMMFFIERTDGGASNITHIPVASKPFLLDVELIRWGSSTDYITRQTFTNAANPANSYVRYCTNGTWGAWTTRVYTDTNTKNTAGSTNTSSKIFLIGATSQAANPQTYSHDTAYVGTDGHLYSNGIQVVNLSGSQALTNKTYNGYTLAAACAKGVDTTVKSGSSNLITSGGVSTALGSYLPLAGGTMNDDVKIKMPYTDGRIGILAASGYKFKIPSNLGFAMGEAWYTDEDLSNNLGGIGAYGTANDISYFYVGGTYNDPLLKVNKSDGNVTAKSSVTTPRLFGSITTGTYLNGNKGGAIINSTASAGSYVMLAKMNSTNGVFTHGSYQTKYLLQYTTNTNISAGNNSVTKSVTLLDESGNSSFPGTVTASAFSGNASSATKWATARNINGLSVDGTANRVNYGTCSTAAATAAKVVACTGFALVTGAEITVKFTVTNTASNPTLNVNGTGNKAIKYRGSNITAGYLAANRTYTFRYDGTNYDLVGDIDTNTNTYVTQSVTTTANYRAILMGYNNSTDASTLTTTVTNQAYASSSIYAQPSTGTLYASKYNGYKVGGDPGNWFSSISVIRNDGVMEAGKYIDFHTTNTGTTDYDVRLTAESGKLTCSGSISAKSFSGNATSASKLATARTITLGSGLQGSVSFDGSANVTLNGSLKRCSFYDDASDWSTYPWRKIANIAVGGSYSDRSITFMVTNSWASPLIGILRAHIRVDGTAGVYGAGHLKWLFLTDTAGTYIKPENFVMVYTNNSGSTLGVEIWVKNTARFNGYMFTVLDESHRTGFYNAWALTTNPERAASYTSGTGVITSTVSTLQNTTYTKLLYSGTGSSIIKISGLTNSSYDLFTVVVNDSSTNYTHQIVCAKGVQTKYCVATTPEYNASSSLTGMLTIGVAVSIKTDTVEVAKSKYIISASSSTPSAATNSRNFTILKVYGHKYYYSS